MKRFTLLLMACFCVMAVHAAYLKDIPVTKTQPDGTVIHCFASGDEYFNYLHDANGYTLMRHPKTGFYVYVEKRDGKLVATDYVVGQYDPAAKGLTPYAIISPEEWSARRKAWIVPDQRPVNREVVPNHGTLNNISIFIRFSDDEQFTNTFSSIDNMFNDVSENANSMINYFKAASYNALTIQTSFYPGHNGETIISYQDSYPKNYYQPYNSVDNPDGYNGDDERRGREFTLLQNAVAYVNNNYPVPTNLNIDYDNDGYVDNVCFIVKGQVGEWSSLLWPHMWTLYDREVYINGKQVYTFNFQLADAKNYFNTGTMCHEMNHTLGAPDLYHYSSSGPTPVGSWDLMGTTLSPPQQCGAYMKMKYGHWIDDIPEITQGGIYELNPLGSSSPENVAYKIASSDPDQYYVLEYRKNTFCFDGVGNSGLLIYRIDTRFVGNADYDPSQGMYDEVYIFRPNGSETEEGDLDKAYFSSHVRPEFSASTNPHPFLSDGTPETNLRIYKISRAGYNTISFIYGCVPPAYLAATVSGRNVTLTWDASQYAQSYNVYRDGTLIGNTEETSFIDSNLAYGTYTYYLKSVDEGGLLSTGSEFAYAAVEPVASHLTAVYSEGNAVLSWTAPEGEGLKSPSATLLPGDSYTYNVYDGTTQLNIEPITGTSFTHETPSSDVAHQYTVRTIYNSGETAASNMAGLTIGTATLSSLKLDEDDMMTVTAGSILAVSSTLSNSVAANLILEDGAQLIHTNAGVQATVEKIISPYTVGQTQGEDLTNGWYFIASPINGNLAPTAIANMLTDANQEGGVRTYDLYSYDATNMVGEESKPWVNYRAHSSSFNIENGKGYLYANQSQVTLQFTGELKPYNEDEGANQVDVSTGWNLVGNPFACNVYANRPFFKMNQAQTGITAVEGYNTNAIAPCTGIIIQAQEAGTVTFTKPTQSNGNNNNNGSLQITLSQATTNERGTSTGSMTVLDNAIVSFNEGEQLGKFYFGTQNANLYIPQEGEDYAIVSAGKQGEMPLNFKANMDGEYTLTVSTTLNSQLSTLNSQLSTLNFNYLHLIDNITGTDIDLLVEPSYTFQAKTTDYASRFRLVFSANDENGASTGSATFAFFNGNEWFISNTGEATLQVVDMMGRVIKSESINGCANMNVDAAAGVYMLRLVNGNDVKVQKVIVR